MDNINLRRFVTARDIAFADENRVRAVLGEMSLEAPDSFIEIVEKLFPTPPPLHNTIDKITRRYNAALIVGYTDIGNGFSKTRVSFSDFATVYRFELAGKHVEAIRHVRICTGLGLKEAKDYCDLVRDEIRSELGVKV